MDIARSNMNIQQPVPKKPEPQPGVQQPAQQPQPVAETRLFNALVRPRLTETARTSAAVKLSKAWDQQQQKSAASKERAAQAKAEFEKEWKAKQEKEQGVAEGADRAEAQADYMEGQCMVLAVAINQHNPKRYPIGYIWEYNMSAGAPDMQMDDDEWNDLSPEEQEEISNDISRHSVVHAYVRDQETNEYIDARGRHKTLPNLWGRMGQTRFEEFPGSARELIDITAHGDWDEVGDRVNFKRGQPAFDSLAGPAGVKRALDYAVKYLGVVGPGLAKSPSVPQNKQGVAEGDRPFRGVGGAFNRGDDERHDLDPTEWYIVKDGKMFKTSVYPNQVQLAIAQGYSRTRDEAKAKTGEQGVAEVSDATKQSYKEKAQAQVRELEPYAKKGEYKDIAQRAIDRRQKGLARVPDKQDKINDHIVKVKGGYELKSKHGNKNLGKYPTRAGAEKRERQVQYFKHAGEGVAIEPDPKGYQKDLLTTPKNSLVIDTPGDLDWYKLGQHYPTLGTDDPHEYGQGDSDMMIVPYSKQELVDLKQKLDRLKMRYKDIGGGHEQPEIHDKVEEDKIKGVDGKACWKGKRYAGKVKKADGTYKDKCVPVSENVENIMGALIDRIIVNEAISHNKR
jgi:hypothetical protein